MCGPMRWLDQLEDTYGRNNSVPAVVRYCLLKCNAVAPAYYSTGLQADIIGPDKLAEYCALNLV